MRSVAICLCSRRVFIYAKTQISKRIFQRNILIGPQTNKNLKFTGKKDGKDWFWFERARTYTHIYLYCKWRDGDTTCRPEVLVNDTVSHKARRENPRVVFVRLCTTLSFQCAKLSSHNFNLPYRRYMVNYKKFATILYFYIRKK